MLLADLWVLGPVLLALLEWMKLGHSRLRKYMGMKAMWGGMSCPAKLDFILSTWRSFPTWPSTP